MEVRKRHIALVVDQEGRARVANPGVVVLHVNHANIFYTVEDLAHRGEILTVHAHGNGLEASNGLDDLGENLLSRLGSAAPHVRAVRPQDPGTLLLLVLTGHIEAVFFRGRFALVDGLHCKLPYRSSTC